jgi:hypothetical protein
MSHLLHLSPDCADAKIAEWGVHNKYHRRRIMRRLSASFRVGEPGVAGGGRRECDDAEAETAEALAPDSTQMEELQGLQGCGGEVEVVVGEDVDAGGRVGERGSAEQDEGHGQQGQEQGGTEEGRLVSYAVASQGEVSTEGGDVGPIESAAVVSGASTAPAEIEAIGGDEGARACDMSATCCLCEEDQDVSHQCDVCGSLCAHCAASHKRSHQNPSTPSQPPQIQITTVLSSLGNRPPSCTFCTQLLPP